MHWMNIWRRRNEVWRISVSWLKWRTLFNSLSCNYSSVRLWCFLAFKDSCCILCFVFLDEIVVTKRSSCNWSLSHACFFDILTSGRSSFSWTSAQRRRMTSIVRDSGLLCIHTMLAEKLRRNTQVRDDQGHDCGYGFSRECLEFTKNGVCIGSEEFIQSESGREPSFVKEKLKAKLSMR